MMIKYRDFETNYSILDINNIDLKKLKPMRKCNIICGKKYGLPSVSYTHLRAHETHE